MPDPPAPVWDPAQYARFAGHRDRPFHELVARVGAVQPTRVADLGCGAGTLTATLAERWTSAVVVGIDSSTEMIARAADLAGPRLSFLEQDLSDWVRQAGPASYDVVVSNAALQWIPGQLDLLPEIMAVLRPGGWLAIQVPGNHDAPLHTILRELAGTQPYAAHAGEAAARFSQPGPGDYIRVLTAAGIVDAWETTYHHVLPGEDAVFEWISGTGARPVLQALPGDLLDRFVADYRARLRRAYPRRPWGTVLPFRRVFAVARRAGDGEDLRH